MESDAPDENQGWMKVIWIVVIGFTLNMISSGINQHSQQQKHEEILGKIEEVRAEVKVMRNSP